VCVCRTTPPSFTKRRLSIGALSGSCEQSWFTVGWSNTDLEARAFGSPFNAAASTDRAERPVRRRPAGRSRAR